MCFSLGRTRSSAKPTLATDSIFKLNRTTALLLGLMLGGISAQPVFAQPTSLADARRSFNVPAGPLGQALNAFASTAGLELTVDASLLQGKSSQGLSGLYSVSEGFTELLRGHGLQAMREANGSYTLSRLVRKSLAAESDVLLSAVTVQAQTSVANAYDGGHVAAGSRLGLLGNKDYMETPFSTISYTDKFVEDRQAREISDVIAATDATVFSNGLTGTYSENFSIRGFSSNIGDVTVGGLFGVAPYYRIIPEMFERIEVLKGPSALLNGMPPGGSVGGAVNLVPKRAGDAPLTRFTASYMPDSQFGGHLDLGRRLGENKQFGIRFNGVYRDGEGAVNQQEKKAQLASLGLDWRGERLRFSSDLYSSVDRIDGLNRGINLVSGLPIPSAPKPETLLNPDWAFVETKDKGAMIRGELDISEGLTAYAAMGSSKTDYKQSGAQTIQVFNLAGDYRTNISQLAFEVDKESAELGLKGRLQTGAMTHQWALNATHYAHQQKDYGRRNVLPQAWVTNIYEPVWGPAPSFNTPLIFSTEMRLASYGLADTLSFAQDKLQLTLGVRQQSVLSDTFSIVSGARTARYEESATTPAAALLFKVSEQFSVYGNYIEGLSQGATAPMTAANAGEVFAPYKTKQKEIGFKFDLGEFAHTISMYEIERPSSYTDPVSNIFSFGGEQRNRGIEWGFFGVPLNGIRLMGGVAYVNPKLTKTAGGVNQGKLATGLPELQAKLGVEWDAAQGLTLTANASAASKQYINADNSLSLPGRTIYDLGARYAVSGFPLMLRASISNVTNKAYWGVPLLAGLGLGAPRTFQFSATVDF